MQPILQQIGPTYGPPVVHTGWSIGGTSPSTGPLPPTEAMMETIDMKKKVEEMKMKYSDVLMDTLPVHHCMNSEPVDI